MKITDKHGPWSVEGEHIDTIDADTEPSNEQVEKYNLIDYEPAHNTRYLLRKLNGRYAVVPIIPGRYRITPT